MSCLILLVNGCASVEIESVCPPPVWMDAPVADELEGIPFEGHEDLYDFLAQIEVLNQQLELCQ